jgi:hypothetical protein
MTSTAKLDHFVFIGYTTLRRYVDLCILLKIRLVDMVNHSHHVQVNVHRRVTMIRLAQCCRALQFGRSFGWQSNLHTGFYNIHTYGAELAIRGRSKINGVQDWQPRSLVWHHFLGSHEARYLQLASPERKVTFTSRCPLFYN